MPAKKKNKSRKQTVRDNIGGDVIKVTNVSSGAAIAAGRGATAGVFQSPNQHVFAIWRTGVKARINTHPGLSDDDRRDANEQIQKIEQEATKGKNADPGHLEKLINTLAVMSSDVFEVAIATLASPLAGIGLVLKKVGDKAKINPAKN